VNRDTLTVTDNRTGQSFEVAIENGAIRARDLIAPFAATNGSGLLIYDPGFMHTATCVSAITSIDADAGVLLHRGYRIEALCEHSTFLELAYLLIEGELPTAAQFEQWRHEIAVRTFVHENLKSFLEGFRYDAHPMAILAASVGALSSFYADAGDVEDEAARQLQVLRLLAKLPTLAAYSYRHGTGRFYALPSGELTSGELSYAGNLLSMMFRMSEMRFIPDPRKERALDVLLMAHADHEQSAAATAVRAVGSTHVDPYSAVAAGIHALSGPMRGAADEAVLKMLRGIGGVQNVSAFLQRIKQSSERVMGFGHAVYNTTDPRATILRGQLDVLYEDRPASPLIAIADELARQAAHDQYFTSRRLYPNVDLYSGLTYEAIGIPQQMFGVMFALARSAGWIAQWREMVQDAEQKAVRPRQIYVGADAREYVPLAQRG
jgi:citrate synthase